MATKTIWINHPPANQTVTRNFAAFGNATNDVTQVQGTMTDAHGTVYNGKVLKAPRHWVIFFSAVPAGGPYTLRVFDPAAGGPSDTANNLTVR